MNLLHMRRITSYKESDMRGTGCRHIIQAGVNRERNRGDLLACIRILFLGSNNIRNTESSFLDKIIKWRASSGSFRCVVMLSRMSSIAGIAHSSVSKRLVFLPSFAE